MSAGGPSQVRYTVYPYRTEVARGPSRRVRFSGREIQELLLATSVMIGAFTLMFLDVTRFGVPDDPLIIGIVVIASTFAVLTGFVLHELAHKVLAQRYGAWSEFRANRNALFFALLTGLFGFVVAAPGAVFSQGEMTRDRAGRTWAAGPATNLAVGALLVLGWLAVKGSPDDLVFLASQILYIGAVVNLILGAFNMIPILGMDGMHVFRWNKALWAGMLAAIVALLIPTYFRLIG